MEIYENLYILCKEYIERISNEIIKKMNESLENEKFIKTIGILRGAEHTSYIGILDSNLDPSNYNTITIIIGAYKNASIEIEIDSIPKSNVQKKLRHKLHFMGFKKEILENKEILTMFAKWILMKEDFNIDILKKYEV